MTDHTDGPRPGAPLWVKVFAAIAVLVVVMLAIALIAGGEHGPGRHVGAVPVPSATFGP
jgi:hypothetical protein